MWAATNFTCACPVFVHLAGVNLTCQAQCCPSVLFFTTAPHARRKAFMDVTGCWWYVCRFVGRCRRSSLLTFVVYFGCEGGDKHHHPRGEGPWPSAVLGPASGYLGSFRASSPRPLWAVPLVLAHCFGSLFGLGRLCRC